MNKLFDGVLTLNGGLRMANSDKFGTHWLPQVGFAVRPAEGWSLKASLAKGYRNPSLPRHLRASRQSHRCEVYDQQWL